MGRRRRKGAGTLVQVALGMASGLVAGWVMNRTEGVLGKVGSRRTLEREALASRAAGEPPTRKVASSVASAFGYRLDARQKRIGATVAHYATAAVWGGAFGLLPRKARRPFLLAGLGFGAALWLVEDELLLTALRLAPRPSAYPLSTHLKGLAAHLVWGASTAGAHRALSDWAGGAARP